MKLILILIALAASCAAQINLPGGGSIKGVQRGQTTVTISGGGSLGSATATVTSVNTAKAIVVGSSYLSNGGGVSVVCTYQVTNATTLTFNCSINNTTGATVIVEWQTLEFN